MEVNRVKVIVKLTKMQCVVKVDSNNVNETNRYFDYNVS